MTWLYSYIISLEKLDLLPIMSLICWFITTIAVFMFVVSISIFELHSPPKMFQISCSIKKNVVGEKFSRHSVPPKPTATWVFSVSTPFLDMCSEEIVFFALPSIFPDPLNAPSVPLVRLKNIFDTDNFRLLKARLVYINNDYVDSQGQI